MPETAGAIDEHEFELLMSLALDDRLNPAEAARFDALLAQAARGSDAGADGVTDAATEWALWQEMDAWLAAEPHVAPQSDFSAAVMQRLAWQERRKRLWLGATIGVAAVLLWGTGLLGVLGLVALVSSNEALWLGEVANSLAYWWAAISGFWVSALRSAAAILATAQARAVILVYCTVSASLLGLWWVWLRRTTRLENDGPILQ